MTANDLLNKAIAIGKMKGSHSSPFICCDLVDQDNLYAVQEALRALMLDIACFVEGGQERLVKEFPFAFKLAKGHRK